MTTDIDAQSSGSDPVSRDAMVQLCGACGHTGFSHDAIARRYCQASRARALDRVCVCTIRGSIDETINEHFRQHSSAIRGTNVRARSTQPNVMSPRCALPGDPARSMLVADPVRLSRGLDQGVDRGEFGPRAPPRSRTAGIGLRSPSSGRCLANWRWFVDDSRSDISLDLEDLDSDCGSRSAPHLHPPLRRVWVGNMGEDPHRARPVFRSHPASRWRWPHSVSSRSGRCCPPPRSPTCWESRPSPAAYSNPTSLLDTTSLVAKCASC